MSVGLYVHIPFCKSKCHYCDFNSYAQSEHLINRYIDALNQELVLYKPHLQALKSVYFGGGTPSILTTEQITRVFDAIRRNYYIREKAELTLEVNPGTCSLDKLRMIRMHGVNRLSIGLQAFDDESLAKLGRIHNVEDFIKVYKDAREAGFDNINVDLIFGLPWQTRKDWMISLKQTILLDPEHISIYNLTIEKETKLGRDLQEGKIAKIPQELEAEMFEDAIKVLKASGYDHYEISNFAKPGRRSLHNQIYWKNEEYLGIGAGATSYLSRVRYTNVKDIPGYMDKILGQSQFAIIEKESLTTAKRIGETIMLNLRMLEGFNKVALGERFKVNIDAMYGPTIKMLSQEGLLKEDREMVMLTDTGVMVANRVFQRFV
jgi:oxygen-independent coproporphyrinogen III oxidase